MGAGHGDRLARGAHSASFGTMSHIKQDKWDAIFGEPNAKTRGRNSNAQKNGTVGTKSRKAKSKPSVKRGL